MVVFATVAQAAGNLYHLDRRSETKLGVATARRETAAIEGGWPAKFTVKRKKDNMCLRFF